MDSPKKPILFLCPADFGAPNQCMTAVWLASKGWPVQFLTDRASTEKTFVTPLATLPADFVTARGRIGKHLGLLCRLLKYRFTGPRKIFFVQGAPCCPSAWLALLGVARERVIYETLDFIEPGRHKFWEFFERRFARRAGAVLSNDSCRARFLGSYYQLRQPVVVERTALPAAWPVPERDEKLRGQMLSTIGRANDPGIRLIAAGGAYSSIRMGPQLLEAIRSLPEHYVVAFSGLKPGSKAEAQTREAVRAAGIESRTILQGFLSFDELLKTFSASDIGILLYPDDGVGNFFQAPGRLTQYARCGLPFVTSNFPGLELLTLKYQLGAACDPRSAEAIAQALRSIGDRSNEALAAWRKRLEDVAKNELSYDVLAVRIEEVVAAAAAARLSALRGGGKGSGEWWGGYPRAKKKSDEMSSLIFGPGR